MNLPELKEDFYKRYSSSDNYLHFTSNGILCTLLGHCGIGNAPSLTCTLSMRVRMFARSLDGNMIKIKHADGTETVYAHNNKNLVKKGETVKAGQAIAKVGSTGNATGNHLHFELLVNGKRIDPATYVGLK